MVGRSIEGVVPEAMRIKGELPREENRQVTYQYAVVAAPADSPDLLAEYGQDGWELVAVVREFGERVIFYFKRRR